MRSTIVTIVLALLSLAAVSSAQEKEQIKQEPRAQKNKVLSGVTKEQQEAVSALALRAGGRISVSWDKENGTPTFFTGDIPSEAVGSKSAGAQQQAALRFLEDNRIIFKLDKPGEELILLQQQGDDLGMSHLKFNQAYKGIPVWASQLIVHFDKDGEIKCINGRYHPSFEISTIPSISKEKAISLAQARAKYESGQAQVELYVYPKDGIFRLAWRVKLPSIAFPNMDILVDATDGRILREDNGIRYQQQVQARSEKKGPQTDNLPPRVERIKWTYDPARTNVIEIQNDQVQTPSRHPPLRSSSTLDQNWQVMMSDGFEQAFPGTTWKRSTSGSATAYWDTTTYKAHTGLRSLYCARSGSSGRDPYSWTTYPNNVYTLVRYGPFSLSDATDAVLQFSHWTITESSFDYFAVLVGRDTVNYTGLAYTGDWTKGSGADANGWQTDYLNLTATGLGDMRGSANVYIGFLFESDGSYSYRGTFLDDVELRKEVLPVGVAATGSGVGLDGTTKALNTARVGTDYLLIDASRAMYVPPIGQEHGVISTWDAQGDTVGNAYGILVRVKDPNNDNNFNDNIKLKAAVDAHYYAGIVYDYYMNTHGRNSWDNKGGTLRNVVHYLNKYNNAFWNGFMMTYGDGDGVTFSSLAGALDVIGHEITHGVIESTAGLLYENQSGALNESYADIFGTFCEFYGRGQSGNWLIGEDIYTPSVAGDALRSMQDPHRGADWQPAHMSEYVDLLNDYYNDEGGVHINSGIPNKACYLLASDIGIQKAERIYYRALATYLTNAAQFVDARNSTLQAATDLYGNGSAEYSAVDNAFTSVGITSAAARELVFDDGYPTSGTAWSTKGAMYAVRMTPPALPVRILKVEYYIAGLYFGNRSFKVHILRDSSGAPGSDLIYPFKVTPVGDGWFSVNLANYISSYYTVANSNFFVGIEYDGTNAPYIGYSDSSNGRGWSRSSSTSTWTLRTRTYYVRAVVSVATETPGTTATASIAPTGAAQVSAGTPFWVEVKVGDPNAVTDLYGIAFKLKSDKTTCTYVDGSVTAGTFLGTSPLTFFRTVDAQTVDVGITKTSLPGSSGSGVVAKAQFTSPSTLTSNVNVIFSLYDITATNLSGASIPMSPGSLSVTLATGALVWPGDCNNDGTVTAADILPIGLYYGQSRPGANNPGNQWLAYTRSYWANEPPGKKVYADADGSGTIDAADLLPAGLNYGKTHQVTASSTDVGVVAARVDQRQLEPEAELSIAPVSLQSSSAGHARVPIVVNTTRPIYGIAFSLKYRLEGAGAQQPALRFVQADTSGAVLRNALIVSRASDAGGIVDIGMTKTSGTGFAGTGTLVNAWIDVPTENVAALCFEITNIEANDADGNGIRVAGTSCRVAMRSMAGELSVPTEYRLAQNYPNPFNPSTTIAFSVPEEARVTLKVFDLLGREVRTLAEGVMPPGEFNVTWDGRNGAGQVVESGVYFYRIMTTSGSGKTFSQTHRMMLMK